MKTDRLFSLKLKPLQKNNITKDPPNPELPQLSRTYILAVIVLTLAKLWLIHNEEIIARVMIYDQSWFINAADHIIKGEWLGPYDKMTLIRQPGYPLWIWLVNLTGIPLRLATESLFLFSCFVFASSLKKAGLPTWLCLLIYLLMIFHPVTIPSNNEAESETFYTPILYLTLSSMIMLYLIRDTKRVFFYAIVTGFFLSLLWNTRHENEYIAIIMATFLVLYILAQFKEHVPKHIILKRSALLLIIPSLTIFCSVIALRTANFYSYGIFSTSELLSKSFISANKALLRIPGNNPTRYVSVPKDAREKAYTVSSAFSEIRPYLEGENGQYWINIWGCRNNHVCNDLGGCFFWALRDAVNTAGHHLSARTADSYYKKIAEEINSSCEKGQLKCRPVFNPFLGFLHPDPSTYLPFISSSFLKLAKMFITPNPSNKDNETESPISPLFDRVANRRTSQIPILPLNIKNNPEYSEKMMLEGWVYSFKEAVTEVQIREANGRIIGFTKGFWYRPDVLNYFKNKGIYVPMETGFSIRTNLKGNNYKKANLVFILSNNEEIKIPLDNTTTPVDSIEYSIDLMGSYWNNPQSGIKTTLGYINRTLIITLGAFSTIAFFIILLGNWSYFFNFKTNIILCLIFVTISARVALVTMLDASAFSLGLEYIRYIFPIMPLLSSFMLILIYRATQVATCYFSHSRAPLFPTQTPHQTPRQ